MGPSLILVAFFLPLGLYLLVLGSINRRSRPLVVSGTWDQIGLLFAASGFLLCGGPVILSSLNERWRLFWLFGEGGVSLRAPDGAWPLWVFLLWGYFVVVVAWAFISLRNQRAVTSVYNVEKRQFERALEGVFTELRLQPVRSGDRYLFGVPEAEPASELAEEWRAPKEGLTLVVAPSNEPEQPLPLSPLLNEPGTLDFEAFPVFRHVALRWDPSTSPLRQEVEAELRYQLNRSQTTEHATGPWLTLAGLFVICLCSMLGLVLVVRSLLEA